MLFFFKIGFIKFDKMLKVVGHNNVTLVLDNICGHLAVPMIDKLEVTMLLNLLP